MKTPELQQRVRIFAGRAAVVLASAYLGLVTSFSVWAGLPFVMGWVPTVVMSGSMEPLLSSGDIVAAQRVSPADLEAGLVRPGHVLLAENPIKPGTLVTHRVVVVAPDGTFTTKGDANVGIDPLPTPASSVIGVERLRVPYLGIPVAAAKSGNPLPLVGFILATAAAVLILSNEKALIRLPAKRTVQAAP